MTAGSLCCLIILNKKKTGYNLLFVLALILLSSYRFVNVSLTVFSFFFSIQKSPDTFYRIRAAYGGIEVALFVGFQWADYSARIVSASF